MFLYLRHFEFLFLYYVLLICAQKVVIKCHVESSSIDNTPLDESSKGSWKRKRTSTQKMYEPVITL